MTLVDSNKVVGVDPDSPASKAGLRAGDLILAVDGVECTEGVTALKLWKDGAGSPVRKLCIAPREVVVAQSPEHFLRQCKKKLRSKQIFFTGKADQKVVVQLLSDFEGSITVQFDQKRAEHLKLRTEDLEHALTADMREARRKRARKKLQRLTVQEEPMRVLHVSEPTHTIHAVPEAAVATKYPELKPTVGTPTRILCATESHWVDPQKLPAPKPKVATEAPNPESTHEQRHATSSSVYVKRSDGEETLAYVKEYDVEKALYTVELERLGSGNVKTCEGKHLREAKWFEPLTFSLSRSAASAHLQLAEVVARARGLWPLNREGQP